MRFPSEVSPFIATNTQPGLTRRESYSTPVTSGFPLWLRNSTPSIRFWKVIRRNYCTSDAVVSGQFSAIGSEFSDLGSQLLGIFIRTDSHGLLLRSCSALSDRRLDYRYEHRNRSREVSLHAVRTI